MLKLVVVVVVGVLVAVLLVRFEIFGARLPVLLT